MQPEPPSQPSDREAIDREVVRVHRSRAARAFFITVGFLSLALGIIGAFLPLLPTTVFVLLAAYCFARSSERFYTALLTNKHFGPAIRDWQRHRCISQRSKTYAIVLIALSFGITTTGFVESTLSRVLLVLLGAALVVYLYRLPSCRHGT
jgi:uncharacterized membrane protein YbaN (DUF454 family)